MMKKSLVLVTIWALSLILVISVYAQEGEYEEIEVVDGGRIVGTVSFVGDVPAPAKLLVDKDQEVCGHGKVPEVLLISAKNKGINNAVVSIADIEKGGAIAMPETNPKLDQKGCVFAPHVLILPAGGRIDILNNDGILHNIHTYSIENPAFNKAQPKFKKKLTTRPTDFEFPETIPIRCDAHGWMSAWIVVAEHPYYAITDEAGSFQIPDVPPGTYTLRYWHESLGKQEKKITVEAKKETKADAQFKTKKGEASE